MRFIKFLPVAFLCVGCVRAEITRSDVAPVRGPFRHILACSLSPDPVQASRIESTMANLLQRHHVETWACSSLGSHSKQVIENFIYKEGIDAVLVFQKGNLSAIAGISPQTLQNLDQFLAAYETVPQTFSGDAPTMAQASTVGKEELVSGTVKLIETHGKQTAVWSSSGNVQAGTATTVNEFVEAGAARIEEELLSNRLIPE
jgi:hypothetical protein